MPLDVGCRSCGTLECVSSCTAPKSLIIPVHNIFLYPESIGKKVDDLEYLITRWSRSKLDEDFFEETIEQCSASLVIPTQEYVFSAGLLFFVENEPQELPILARFPNCREWLLMDGHHRIGAHILQFGRIPFQARCLVFNEGLVL